jgi:hypothetical protein
MLNWRPVRDIEARTNALRRESEQIKNEILLVRSDRERIEKETERLRQINAREKALSASIRELCFPPESNSTPPTPTEPDSKPSSP